MEPTSDPPECPSRPADGSPERRFYAELRTFPAFDGFSDPQNYYAAPNNWRVVVADIQGSTKAIREGRYKDVNMMGAACIVSVLNALKTTANEEPIPYVYGGDGATLLIPESAVETVRDSLVRTRTLCGARFGLGLRVGIVPVADVRARGADVRVAKFELSPGNHEALFAGGGVELADALIKDEVNGAAYRVDDADAGANPDLDGLTCRWSPIHTRNGVIVSMLIAAPGREQTDRSDVFRRVFAALNDCLGGNLSGHSPAKDERLNIRWPPTHMKTEVLATAGRGMWAVIRTSAFVLFQSAIQVLLHWSGRRAGEYNAPVYKQELIANTDFRRYDDVLRLVLDCTAEQVDALDRCLAAFRAEDGIAYGMHMADTALMTCLVFDLAKSEHIHFIDGGDGGFAVAAVQLKAQLAEDRT